MKLKNLLQYKNRLFYIAISLTLIILVMNSLWYIILVIPYLYYIYKNHKDLIILIIVILIIYLVSLLILSKIEIKENDTYSVTVIKDIKVDNYTSFLGKINGKYIKVYFDDKLSIKPGDKLIISGDIESPVKSTIPNTFDYKNYLRSQNIKYTIFTKSVEYEKSSFSIYILPYFLEKYIDKYQPLSGGYIKTFILAEKTDIDSEVKDQINEIGISHLFAVSGLHIALLVVSIEHLLKKTNLNKTKRENLIMALLLSYLIITSFSPSVTRASIMYIFLIINKRFVLQFSSLDILSIIFILLLFIRPYYYHDAGFLLSFLVTFTIILASSILRKDNKIHQLFLISLIAFLVTIPIILKLNYQINVLTLLLNIIFLIYVSYVILPLSYISFLLPIFDKLNYVFIKIFEFFLGVFSSLDFFIFKFYFPNDFSVITYYFLVFILLISFEKNSRIRQSILTLAIFLIFVYFTPYLEFRKSISFIDIYGDSTLIRDSFNKCNMLIDTGDTDDYDSLINYLKSNNIRRLDYLIISHFHSDHFGEAYDILTEFEVNTIISNKNVSLYENKNIICGSISMFIYPYDYEEKNENNNSLIISLFISDKHYLFTGDIEQSRELDFISEYNIDIDYLKVPHHGSKTSSNIPFIESITPEEVFIIVSISNTHGHPNDEIIKSYREMDIIVHRTDLMGTIEVYYLFGKEYKRIHSP